MRCSFASSSTQYSMSKASCSAARRSRRRRRAAHDVDGVAVELGRDPRRGFVRGEGEHADAGNQKTTGLASRIAGVGMAGSDRSRRRSRRDRPRRLDRARASSDVAPDRTDQRPDFGAQEVVGAARCRAARGPRTRANRRIRAPPARRRNGPPCARSTNADGRGISRQAARAARPAARSAYVAAEGRRLARRGQPAAARLMMRIVVS